MLSSIPNNLHWQLLLNNLGVIKQLSENTISYIQDSISLSQIKIEQPVPPAQKEQEQPKKQEPPPKKQEQPPKRQEQPKKQQEPPKKHYQTKKQQEPPKKESRSKKVEKRGRPPKKPTKPAHYGKENYRPSAAAKPSAKRAPLIDDDDYEIQKRSQPEKRRKTDEYEHVFTDDFLLRCETFNLRNGKGAEGDSFKVEEKEREDSDGRAQDTTAMISKFASPTQRLDGESEDDYTVQEGEEDSEDEYGSDPMEEEGEEAEEVDEHDLEDTRPPLFPDSEIYDYLKENYTCMSVTSAAFMNGKKELKEYALQCKRSQMAQVLEFISRRQTSYTRVWVLASTKEDEVVFLMKQSDLRKREFYQRNFGMTNVRFWALKPHLFTPNCFSEFTRTFENVKIYNFFKHERAKHDFLPDLRALEVSMNEDGINEDEMFRMVKIDLEVRKEEKAEKGYMQ